MEVPPFPQYIKESATGPFSFMSKPWLADPSSVPRSVIGTATVADQSIYGHWGLVGYRNGADLQGIEIIFQRLQEWELSTVPFRRLWFV